MVRNGIAAFGKAEILTVLERNENLAKEALLFLEKARKIGYFIEKKNELDKLTMIKENTLKIFDSISDKNEEFDRQKSRVRFIIFSFSS